MTGKHLALVIFVCLLAGGLLLMIVHKVQHPGDDSKEMANNFGIGVGLAAAGLVVMGLMAWGVNKAVNKR